MGKKIKHKRSNEYLRLLLMQKIFGVRLVIIGAVPMIAAAVCHYPCDITGECAVITLVGLPMVLTNNVVIM